MSAKPDIKYFEETKLKWVNALESLKKTPLNKVALKDWFDEINSEKCGFCKYYKICEKCPLVYSLICARVSDKRLAYWRIYFACLAGDKELALKGTQELLDKLEFLRIMFEEPTDGRKKD